MKFLQQNENGYSLLITFAVIIIFTVLGLSLITLTSGVLQKTTLGRK